MFREQIRKEIKKVLNKMNITETNGFDVARPQEKKFGDYSTNIAMVLAGKLKRPPFEIAQEIVGLLNKASFINRVSIERPAFINFHLSDRALLDNMTEIANGKIEIEPKKNIANQKIILEHTNVNPNKAIHVGHLRSACLGDAVKNILEKNGRQVEVEYYVDNTGLQVAITLLGFQHLKNLELETMEREKFDHFAGRVYVAMNKKMKEDPQLEIEKDALLEALEDYNSSQNNKNREIVAQIINANLETASRYGIGYDALIWESDIFQFKLWEETFEKLKKIPAFYLSKKGKNKDCWVLLNSDGKEKVIIKSNGIITYTGKDIAYHFWKYGLLKNDFKYKKWEGSAQQKPLFSTSVTGKKKTELGHGDAVLNFIDIRQAFPQESVKSALEISGCSREASRFRHVGYGIVFLSVATAKKLGLEMSSEKTSYALSGRDGLIVNADDLLEVLEKEILKNHPKAETVREIAVGAIKYYLLRQNPFGEIVFDYSQALDIHGNSGPYLQYAHARAANILKKIKDKKINKNKNEGRGNDWKEEERNLIRALVHYKESIILAGKQYSPNLLAVYLFELAALFNSFYNRHQVLNCNDPVTADLRKSLVKATKNVLHSGLTMLGIPAPEKI